MKLTLHVPSIREMDYRQKLLADPETMRYNAHQPWDADGYDAATGCIDFPITDWRYWRDVWLWHEPARFSAYVMDEDTGEFLGEVCYYYDMETDMHGAGIIIQAQCRGRGYGAQALQLLAQKAFAHPEVDCLFMDLPLSRESAVRMAITAGFHESFTEQGVCRMILKKQ